MTSFFVFSWLFLKLGLSNVHTIFFRFLLCNSLQKMKSVSTANCTHPASSLLPFWFLTPTQHGLPTSWKAWPMASGQATTGGAPQHALPQTYALL